MHLYLSHLLADIAAAHRSESEIVEEENNPQTIEQYFEEVDLWLAGKEPPHTFGYYCGLESVNFPPSEQLSEEEMEMICSSFKKMMYTWKPGISLPENLPVAFAYTMIVDSLNSKTDIPNNGFMDFDLCSGYAPGCVFKEYCPCWETWNSIDDDDPNMSINLSGKELPF